MLFLHSSKSKKSALAKRKCLRQTFCFRVCQDRGFMRSEVKLYVVHTIDRQRCPDNAYDNNKKRISSKSAKDAD